MSTNEWPLWEVFIRSKQGLNHKHVGSLRAPDAEDPKGFQFGSYNRHSLRLQILQILRLILNLQIQKYIVIPHFMTCRMALNTCNYGTYL
jgi:hypothetical protein